MLGRFCGALGLVSMAVFALPSASFASTVLIDKGAYTYDTASGLDWLDPSATAGYSYDDVEQNDTVDGVALNYIADGWRYATLADLKTLSANLGLPIPDGSNEADSEAPETIASVSTLANTFGWTMSSSTFGNYLTGIYGPPSGGSVGFFGFYLYGPGTADAEAGSFDDGLFLTSNSVIALEDTDGSEYFAGSFLVRDDSADVAATPLPGSSLLFASGLGVIGFVAWRRKQGGASASFCA